MRAALLSVVLAAGCTDAPVPVPAASAAAGAGGACALGDWRCCQGAEVLEPVCKDGTLTCLDGYDTCEPDGGSSAP